VAIEDLELKPAEPGFDPLLVEGVELYLQDGAIDLADLSDMNGRGEAVLKDVAEIIGGSVEEATLIISHIIDSAAGSSVVPEGDAIEDEPTVPGIVDGERTMIPLTRLGVSLLPLGVIPLIEQLPNKYDFTARRATTFEPTAFSKSGNRDGISTAEDHVY
jgi:hypothetical protein